MKPITYDYSEKDAEIVRRLGEALQAFHEVWDDTKKKKTKRMRLPEKAESHDAWVSEKFRAILAGKKVKGISDRSLRRRRRLPRAIMRRVKLISELDSFLGQCSGMHAASEIGFDNKKGLREHERELNHANDAIGYLPQQILDALLPGYGLKLAKRKRPKS